MDNEKINPYRGPYHWFLSAFYTRHYVRKAELCREFLTANDVVLDVGCGDGKLTSELGKYCKRVVGVDNQEIAITFAKLMVQGTDNVSFLVEDGRSLKSETSFDVVTSFDVIEHIPVDDVRGFVEQLSDKLKPGGTLIITTPNRNELRGRIWGHNDQGTARLAILLIALWRSRHPRTLYLTAGNTTS